MAATGIEAEMSRRRISQNHQRQESACIPANKISVRSWEKAMKSIIRGVWFQEPGGLARGLLQEG
jgi:hypothetical protein